MQLLKHCPCLDNKEGWEHQQSSEGSCGAVFRSQGGSCSPGAHHTSEELQVLNSEWLHPLSELGTEQINWQDFTPMGGSFPALNSCP